MRRNTGSDWPSSVGVQRQPLNHKFDIVWKAPDQGIEDFASAVRFPGLQGQYQNAAGCGCILWYRLCPPDGPQKCTGQVAKGFLDAAEG